MKIIKTVALSLMITSSLLATKPSYAGWLYQNFNANEYPFLSSNHPAESGVALSHDNKIAYASQGDGSSSGSSPGGGLTIGTLKKVDSVTTSIEDAQYYSPSNTNNGIMTTFGTGVAFSSNDDVAYSGDGYLSAGKGGLSIGTPSTNGKYAFKHYGDDNNKNAGTNFGEGSYVCS